MEFHGIRRLLAASGARALRWLCFWLIMFVLLCWFYFRPAYYAALVAREIEG